MDKFNILAKSIAQVQRQQEVQFHPFTPKENTSLVL